LPRVVQRAYDRPASHVDGGSDVSAPGHLPDARDGRSGAGSPPANEHQLAATRRYRRQEEPLTRPPDTFTAAGITWEMAMANAARILTDLPEKPKMGNTDWWAARSAQAQAWIAFARELTMHTRATR
jgi:hypothetical protein